MSEVAVIKSGTTPKTRDKSLKLGTALLKTNNIRNNILFDFSNTELFYIDDETNKKMLTTQLENKDILINIVGATTDVIGRCSLVYNLNNSVNITQAMAFCRIVDSSFMPEYLFVFLISKYGNKQTRRIARQTGQYNMNLEELASFRVFKPSNIVQQGISLIIKKSYSLKMKSELLYTQAEELLLEELGLKDFKPNNDKVNVKTFSQSFSSTGRLDAEYYQKKYDEIENVIKNYTGGISSVNDVFKINKNTIPTDFQSYAYIEISDISIADGSYTYNDIDKNDLPANAKISLKKNDLLISKVRPYRGAVSLVTETVENLIGSGAFTVLREKSNYKKEVLFLLLRTPIYKNWILKWNVGSSYPVIKDEDILQMPIPLLDQEIQLKIKNIINETSLVKERAKQLLGAAKQAVEIAIEESEEKAMSFISKLHIE